MILASGRVAAQQQSIGPGARVRITTDSTLTLKDLAEMAGALPGADIIRSGRSTIS
jgi:hypothetical protein